MNPKVPVLMIGLQIPVLPDTNVEQVLEVIGEQISAALEKIRREPQILEEANEDPETVPQAEFNASVLAETREGYSDDTRPDLLAALGYGATE